VDKQTNLSKCFGEDKNIYMYKNLKGHGNEMSNLRIFHERSPTVKLFCIFMLFEIDIELKQRNTNFPLFGAGSRCFLYGILISIVHKYKIYINIYLFATSIVVFLSGRPIWIEKLITSPEFYIPIPQSESMAEQRRHHVFPM